ncbi:hypothetical protein Acr_21g0007750 [Actinidia rufa]|uniref:Transcription initiation factor TFIID component TAF4 C-terminal domain-containing protein n=1 Tax=Actinidia rufa TaxID=165716 RepID=A0A7J0GH95_9ERIC|nr:hypothetical protein Acr_21g0007750 [Actinidia rufa]
MAMEQMVEVIFEMSLERVVGDDYGGLSRKSARNQVMMSQPKVTRSVSIKDVIAVLEREPQMSKTTLIYRLHEKTRADAVAE